uniref:Uncharacterized protein n=1 Tax=Brassica oleracea TaxID=3712 RepID=A0A3P6GIG3_BRAOL|nr:unnamed protein product [Brassica oleracea]
MDRRDLRKMLIDPGSTDSVVLEVKVWPRYGLKPFLIDHLICIWSVV